MKTRRICKKKLEKKYYHSNKKNDKKTVKKFRFTKSSIITNSKSTNKKKTLRSKRSLKKVGGNHLNAIDDALQDDDEDEEIQYKAAKLSVADDKNFRNSADYQNYLLKCRRKTVKSLFSKYIDKNTQFCNDLYSKLENHYKELHNPEELHINPDMHTDDLEGRKAITVKPSYLNDFVT